MSLIKKLSVSILSLIAIFLLVLLSFTFTFSSFLYPNIYFTAFEKAGVYSYLEENLNNSGKATFIDFQDGVRPTIEKLFSNFLAYLRSDTDNLDLTVKIDQEKLRNFFLDAMGNLSQCTPNQNPFDKTNPCLPKGQTPDQFLDDFLYANNLSFFESDTVDLTAVYSIEKGSEQRQGLENIRQYVSYYSFSKFILILLIIIILFLIFLLERPNTNKFLRTSAYIFVMPSISLFALVFALSNLDQVIQFPDLIFDSMYDVVKSVLVSKILIYASIIAIIGICLFISSFFVKQAVIKQDKKQKKV